MNIKCTKFNFGWGGGAYSAPPDPLAGFKEPTSKGREGREGKGGKGWGRGGGWDGTEGKGGEGGREGEWRGGKGERMWRGPESGLPRGPCWLSAGLQVCTCLTASSVFAELLNMRYRNVINDNNNNNNNNNVMTRSST